MELQPLNIVSLIEANPITKLTSTYQVKILEKIKERFTSFEQQLFLSSFYCYLNYHQTLDFVIDLDNVWKWMGFSQKIRAKELLEKNFTLDIDYKKSAVQNLKPVNGGQNKQIIMMNIRTFKSLCLKSQTKKAEEIHNYYINLEEVVQDTIIEQCETLTKQLVTAQEELKNKNELINKKDTEIEEITNKGDMDLKRMKEKTLISSYPDGKQVVYIGKFEDKLKFGFSDNIKRRINEHKNDFGPQFILLYVVESSSNVRIEKEIKKILKSRIVSKVINEKNQTELIQISDEYTAEMFYQQILDIKDNFLKTLTIESLEKEINEHIFRITELENIEIQLNAKIKAMEKTIMIKDKEFQEINKRAIGSNSWALELQKDNELCMKRIKDFELKLQKKEENSIENKVITKSQSEPIVYIPKIEEQINPIFEQDTPNLITISEPEPIIEKPELIIEKPEPIIEKPEPIIEKPEPIIENLTIEQVNKKAVKVKKNDKNIIARNIKTGEERTYKTYTDVYIDPDIQIGVHSLPQNYLNKPVQYKGFVFYEFGKPYWQPPDNFIYYVMKKPSTHMQMCKSVEISTGNVLFFNSMIEASWHLSLIYKDFPYNETNRRTLRHACEDGKKSIIYPISLFEWSKCNENIGYWKNK
jgi:hypothetical protein